MVDGGAKVRSKGRGKDAESSRVKKPTPEDEVTNLHQLEPQHGILGIVLLLFCGTVSSYLCTYLPEALTTADLGRHPTAFIAERAWENLQVLNDFGPKPTGSRANELGAADYIRREIEKVKATAHTAQLVETAHQTVSGAYPITFLGNPLTSVYRNVQNLVVRLAGRTDGALMLNCHYDTVASSPGASDDGGSCVVMLEILRVLSRAPKRNRHAIVFLFNGAEETPLQAAHGFVSDHRWAQEVRAFLNLESAGSGGKEQLFQAGPQHPWLIGAYGRAVRHPAAQALSEEIFQSGLVPSDTDFRIFRDFGHVPGMDFAHTINGYRYHTRFDTIDYLTLPVLQRTGDNILELTRELVNGDELGRANVDATLTEGYSVFFDVLGLFFVHYSASTARVVNVGLAVLSLLIPLMELCRPVRQLGWQRSVVRQSLVGVFGTVCGTGGSLVVVLTIGNRLDAIGRAMSWFSTPYLILGLYGCPVILVHCVAHRLCSHWFGDKKSPLNLTQMVRSRLVGVNLFWALIIIALTLANIRSAYILVGVLLMSLMSTILTSVLGYQHQPRRWLLLHLAFQIPILLWATKFYHLLLKLFVPITGRMGASSNPEYLVAVLVACFGLLCISYLVPLVGLLKQTSELTARLTVFALIAFLLGCCTQVGFPYRDEGNGEPSVQRHYVTHTLQEAHSQSGAVVTSSGFLLREMDRNALRVIRGVAKPSEVFSMRQMDTCGTMLFCGVPFYSIWHQIRFDNYWLEGPPPAVEKNTVPTFELVQVVQQASNVRRYNFNLTHRHQNCVQSALIISPRPGAQLVKWSLMESVPGTLEFNGQRAHFALITYGLAEDAPWPVTFDFEYDAARFSSEADGGMLFDVSWVNTYWEYADNHTEEFQKLIEKFPEWAHVIPSVAVVLPSSRSSSSSSTGRRMKSKEHNYDPNIHRLPWYGGWLLIALVAFCGTVSYLSFFHLPPALTEADLAQHPHAFNGARAWDVLVRLDALGPKPTGSPANEEQAVQLLEHELALINASRHNVQEVLYDKQITSGQYGINFFGSSMTSVYRRVQNLIVKLVGAENRHALMLNCHFDSVASSPGASDDCGSCAVMLELLRVLSRQPAKLRHSIVFLFNGAEETPLQASHGFITGHRWAREVRAFLNLESAGSGGKELLFQSGPQHPWLIEAYARAVRHPFGQAVGEEIFQSGLIPSDTDFRIFRDFGHIPGLDFAHIFNGYRYHTRYDSVQYLSPAVLQRTGDNMLSLVRLLADGDQLAHAADRATGHTVYFDFLGLFFVSYSATEGTVLNVLVSVGVLLIGCWNVLSIVGWSHWRSMVLEMLHGFVATLVGAGAAIGLNLATAFGLDHFMDRSMAWYSSYGLAIGLYCVPTLMLLLVAHREFHRLFSKSKTVLSLTLTVQARITGVCFFWSLITLGATVYGLRSAYVIAILLTLSLFGTMLITLLKLQSFPSSYWLTIYMIVHSVALLWTTQFFHIFANIFIPITGRSGAGDNPDFIIGIVAAGCTIFAVSFLVPLINLLRKPYRTIGALFVFFVGAMVLAIATPIGFPYRAAGTSPEDAPKVQRILVQHTVRQFFEHNDTVRIRSSDAGYLFRLWDRHNERTVRDVLGTEQDQPVVPPTSLPECKTVVFCGLPGSAIRFSSLWSPQSNPPHAPAAVQLLLMAREEKNLPGGSSKVKLRFNLIGSFQASLLLRLKHNVTLASWNLSPEVPKQLSVGGSHRAYFVLITHGLPDEPMELTLDLETHDRKNADMEQPLLDISVTSNFWEYHEHFTDSFREFVASFPNWAHVVPSVTVVNVYSF
uniref:FXNA-like protease n=1 Tax=Anopheles dirus TaxID=7168 RepID=A0A182NKV7_9DIPT